MSRLLQFRRKLRKATKLASKPLWRAAARKGVMAAVEHRDTLEAIDFDTLIDVGSNKGQFSLLARGVNPNCKVFAFDPLPESEMKFGEVLAQEHGVSFRRLGLGSKAETLSINVTASNDSSSFFMPLEIDDYRGNTRKVAEQDVRVERLDSVIAPSDLSGKVLLKLDVQGFEKEVILGASGLIEKIDWIYAELCFAPLYDGQPLFNEVHETLTEFGFMPVKIGHVSGFGNHIQSIADVLYENTQMKRAVERCEKAAA